MVSRQKILKRTRSRDDISDEIYPEPEDDVWHNHDLLLKDHMQEVLQKWEQIDDEIWAKVIVFERNRRVAKAYVRSPILTINSSDIGFDGYRIGLGGFENPMRDAKTLDIINRQIGLGIKVRMDDSGNILVKKVCKSAVYIKPSGEENAINIDINSRNNNLALSHDQPAVVFDIRKFEDNVDYELKKPYPNRMKLESQCIFGIVFCKNASTLLQCPSWVMIINIVAMDMLKSKLPLPIVKLTSMKDRPRQPVPEEDIYSMTSSGPPSNGYSGSGGKDKKDKPPKLPPRDVKNGSKGEYDEPQNVFRRITNGRKNNNNNVSRTKEIKHDDPYYSGLLARSTFNPLQPKIKDRQQEHSSRVGHYPHVYLPGHNHHRAMFQSRSFDSGME